MLNNAKKNGFIEKLVSGLVMALFPFVLLWSSNTVFGTEYVIISWKEWLSVWILMFFYIGVVRATVFSVLHILKNELDGLSDDQ